MRKLAAPCRCAAAADGMRAGWHNPGPQLPCYLPQAGLTGLGDRNVPPSLLKLIHAGVHSCFPKGCTQRWWPAHCLEGFSPKVIRNQLASCYVSSMTAGDWPCGKKGLWIKKTNNRCVEMSWPAKDTRTRTGFWKQGVWLVLRTSLPSFSILKQVDLEVRFWSLVDGDIQNLQWSSARSHASPTLNR